MILYRVVLVLLLPVLAIVLGIRWLRGRESAAGLAERLGHAGGRARSGRAIWLHGASVGELTAARPLVQALLDRDGEVRVVLSCNTYTGRDMVRAWAMPRVEGRLAPLDYRAVVGRFCRAIDPAALVVLENELWPNRLAICDRLGIPVLVASARMSDRASSGWGRFPGLARRVTKAITFLAPVDDIAAGAFHGLGMDPSRIGPALVLKSTVLLDPPDAAGLARLQHGFPRRDTVLAASTHDGEEEPILRAFATARRKRPGLRLILAPRHPARAETIQRLVDEAGLSCERRSATDGEPGDAPVLLADTLGEMALWYSLAGVTLIGGTWVARGGHTPFEPAQFDSAIVHGPSIHNHAGAFAALSDHGGAVMAGDADAIAAALVALDDDGRRRDLARRATSALAPFRSRTAELDGFAAKVLDLAKS